MRRTSETCLKVRGAWSFGHGNLFFSLAVHFPFSGTDHRRRGRSHYGMLPRTDDDCQLHMKIAQVLSYYRKIYSAKSLDSPKPRSEAALYIFLFFLFPFSVFFSFFIFFCFFVYFFPIARFILILYFAFVLRFILIKFFSGLLSTAATWRRMVSGAKRKTRQIYSFVKTRKITQNK